MRPIKHVTFYCDSVWLHSHELMVYYTPFTQYNRFGWNLFPSRWWQEAELAWVAWWNTEVVFPPEEGHPSLGGLDSNSRPLSRKPDAITIIQTKPRLYRKRRCPQYLSTSQL